MKRLIAIVVVAVAPVAAHADANAPSMLALGFGVASDIGPSDEAVPVVSVFGRVGVTSRFALEAELDKSYADSYQVDDRCFTLVGTFDLIDLIGTKHFVPMVLAGAGLDWSDGPYNNTTGQHVEAGAAFEYRLDAGLTIGIDVRVGYRNVSTPPQPLELPNSNGTAPLDPPVDPSQDLVAMSPGSYMNTRLYAGIHF